MQHIGNRWVRYALGTLPFLLLTLAYVTASNQRHAENESDKLLPTYSQMATAFSNAATQENRRSGEIILWVDTAASLQRLALGVAIAALSALCLGVAMGLFASGDALLRPFMTTIAMIPPLAVLPILFLTLGVDELAKVSLIVFGLFPLMARDIDLAVSNLPGQQMTKAATLGASPVDLVVRIVLPQVLPRLLESVRLSLGAAWLFLIAAEAIAAESGLGYRIFLVRRYLAMDLILPYVMWITAIGFSLDLALRLLSRWAFPWYAAGKPPAKQ